MEPIEKIILTILHTAWLDDGIPISLLIVGPSGAGKSKTVLRFKADGVHRTDDLTSSGLYDLLKKDQKNELRYILLGDFNPVLSHKAAVSNLTIASMLSLMSDGTVRVDDGREMKDIVHRPVGFMSACTDAMYKINMKKWSQLGITRRFFSIFYDYSPQTELLGQREISRQNVTLNPLCVQQLRKPLHCKVEIPKVFHSAIESLSGILASHLGYYTIIKKEDKTNRWTREVVAGKPLLKFTPQLYLQQIVKGHALLKRHNTVNENDIEWLQELLTFTNSAKPGII